METPTLKQISKILNSPSWEPLKQTSIAYRKLIVSMIYIFVDMFVLSASILGAVLIRNFFMSPEIMLADYLTLMPFILPIFPLAYYFRGLYPGFGIDVIEELRTLTYSTSVVFAVLATTTFFFNGTWEYSRLAFILSWLISLPAVPLAHAGVRKILAGKDWWGIPVMIIGAGRAGEMVIKSLNKHVQTGLRPIIAVDDDVDRWGYIKDIPVVGGLDIVPEISRKLGIDHAIIAMPRVSGKRQQEIIMTYSKYFEHTTVIPDLFGISSLWVSTRDLGGILGLEVQQKLIRKSSQLKKRIFDIILSSILGLLLFPIYLVVSAAIKLDSKGKVFFRQLRMGMNDINFQIIKFRTMHLNAESKLNDILDKNEDLREEYNVYHKLSNDPRMTRIGRLLRKFSIDELPQFINVLKGEMSLIGPRAYLPTEKEKMAGLDEMILQVKPGISGLWQVTDRNQSSFEERNNIDVYYIRNWSMFLDFYILARTIAVILTGKGV